MSRAEIKVKSIDNTTGTVNIAGGNIYIGLSVDQVTVLVNQILTATQVKPFDGRCPYKGLGTFEETDADLFFGRENFVNDLVGRVGKTRTVFVTGPSGSGKSSLVRAGLLPALKHGALPNSQDWLYASLKPGRDPFESLAGAFSRLKSPDLANYFRQNSSRPEALNECVESALSDNPNHRLLLFIDQLEELFTQNSVEKAASFIETLAHAIGLSDGRLILLFAMRSDFISTCATFPSLNALLNQQLIQITAMQPDELVRAIAKPVTRVGLVIEPGLIAQIIQDMQGEPGALPLMQFALKDLFDARQAAGGSIALSLADYHDRGGIHKALERHANEVFKDLDPREQALASSIFGRLIEIGKGAQDTRRTARFDELQAWDGEKDADLQIVLRKLADARLITTDEVAGADTFTIAHEKLIDAWPWLKKLVNDNRAVIALQNQIEDDALEWQAHNRDDSYLYTGARLADAREKLGGISLDSAPWAFLDACIREDEAKKAAREAVLQNERLSAYSYLTLRRAIGILGFAFPLVITVGSQLIFQTGVQSSLSAYYYTGMRDVFVGFLCAIAMILFVYKGSGTREDIANRLTGIFAIGVAIFPTAADASGPGIANILHSLSFVLFLLMPTYSNIFLLGNPASSRAVSREVLLRKQVYKSIGWTISICSLLMVLSAILPAPINQLHPVFWLETIAYWAFGLSWMTRGRLLIKAQEE